VFAQPGRACSFCGRDLWDVAHYVSAGPVAICDQCIDAAREVVERASPTDGRELFLEPRVFGEGGDAEDAASIAGAFRAVFTSESSAESRAAYIDGNDDVKQALDEAHARLPGMAASTRVERIRFLDADVAEVRFQINLGVHPMGPLVEGRAVRKQGRWMVSSDTVARVVSLGGASVFGRTLNT
jgi:ClpX C4-type zinc finger protein